jgi:hypothetical protein
MPELRVHRSTWHDFPDVIVQTTIAKLKAHPDYPMRSQAIPKLAFGSFLTSSNPTK